MLLGSSPDTTEIAFPFVLQAAICGHTQALELVLDSSDRIDPLDAAAHAHELAEAAAARSQTAAALVWYECAARNGRGLSTDRGSPWRPGPSALPPSTHGLQTPRPQQLGHAPTRGGSKPHVRSSVTRRGFAAAATKPGRAVSPPAGSVSPAGCAGGPQRSRSWRPSWRWNSICRPGTNPTDAADLRLCWRDRSRDRLGTLGGLSHVLAFRELSRCLSPPIVPRPTEGVSPAGRSPKSPVRSASSPKRSWVG